MTTHLDPKQNPTSPTTSNISENPEITTNSPLEELQAANTSGTSTAKIRTKALKKSIGHGLYEIRKGNTFAGYQLRKMIDGNQMDIFLGKITEQEARKEVEKLLKKPSQLQRTRKVEKTVSKMKAQKRAEEAIPCFRSYEDAGRFARALQNKLAQNLKEFKNENSDGLELEIYTVIWTMLSTPLGIKDLLECKQKDAYIQFSNAASLMLVPDQYQKPYIINLTNTTAKAIFVLNQYQGHNPDQLIFQQLNALSKKDRGSQIDSKINEIWPSSQINPETFMQFFQHVANRRSIFKQEFIELFIKKQITNPEWQRNGNERMMSNWWENQLTQYLLSPVGF